MTTKTIKTMLFASLIAAIILPFSTMDFADAKVQTENKGKLYIKDIYELAPDTLTEEKRNMIRDHIVDLSLVLKEKLTDGSIPMVGVGTDYKEESLKVKILKEHFSSEKLDLYEKRIREIVGNEVDITFIPGSIGTYTVCSQNGDCEPIQAGTRISIDDGLICSMGFKASYDSKTGFVTAGHCLNGDIGGTGNDVGNPTNSTSDKLGVVYANAFMNNTYCDCIFVDASESVSDKIWNGVDVSGLLFPTVTDSVKWEGIASDGSADILDNFETIAAEVPGAGLYVTLGAVEIDQDFMPGDSGAPVYEDVSSGTPKFAGTVSGNQDGNGFYIPYYRYANAFSGLTFTFT